MVHILYYTYIVYGSATKYVHLLTYTTQDAINNIGAKINTLILK